MTKIFKSLAMALCVMSALACSAQAKWWIFGKSNQDVGLKYVYLNGVSFEETGTKLTMYSEMLSEGTAKLSGKAYVGQGKVGSVRVTVDNKENWTDAKFSDDGAFEYLFKPVTGKNYVIYVEVTDTAGKTNDIEATRKEVSVSQEGVRAAVQKSLDDMVAAYQNQDPEKFMLNVDDEFAGDSVNLDRAIRKDFSFFSKTEISFTINNVLSDSAGKAVVNLNYRRFLINKKDAKSYQDSGTTQMVFKTGEKGFRVFSMKVPLLFGLSDQSNVATGVVNPGGNATTIVVDGSGNVNVVPVKEAASGDAAGIETASMTDGCDVAFDFAGAEVIAKQCGPYFSPGEKGDITFHLCVGGENLVGNPAGGVQMVTGTIDSVTTAPSTGYATSSAGCKVGQLLAVKTTGGKYALFQITSETGTHPNTVFSFKYRYPVSAQ